MQSNSSIGGMNTASLQDMQRLQQQLQQQQQQQQQFRPQQQQLMGMPAFAASGAMNPQQQLAALQQQQQQQQPQMTSNTALALMQQQQQANANATGGMLSANSQNALFATSWNGIVGGGTSLDASTGSSARLMAMSGMGTSAAGFNTSNPSIGGLMSGAGNQQQQNPAVMGGVNKMAGVGGGGMMDSSSSTTGSNNSSKMQNMQILLQHQKGQGATTTTTTTTPQQLLIQRQLASLQQQQQLAIQQQQGMALGGQQQQQQQGKDTNSATLFQAQQQQQLLQQMQQQQQQLNPAAAAAMMQSGSSNTVMGMMQQMAQQQQQQQPRHSPAMQFSDSGQQQTNSSNAPTLDEQRLRMHQQSLLQSSGGANSGRSSAEPSVHHSTASSSRHQSYPHQQSHLGMQQQQNNPQQTMTANSSSQFSNQQAMNDASMNSHSLRSNASTRTHSNVNTNSIDQGGESGGLQQQKSFLDGSFAGGWQSNDDLPDRRQVIFRILEVIRQMRPDANSVPASRFPHMAKTLEEHLYRSANTKEEYMNFTTLRQRLQAIAQHLEFQRGAPPGNSDNGRQTSTSSSHGFGSFQGNTNDSSSQSIGQQQSESWSSGGMTSSQMGSSSHHQQASMSSVDGSLQQYQQFNTGHAGGSQQQQQFQGSWSSNNNGNNLVAQNSGQSLGDQQSLSTTSQNGVANYAQNLQQSNHFSGSGQTSQQQISMQSGWQVNAPSQQHSTTGSVTSSSKEPVTKKKVIQQQQQRLLLLRHASKCTAGPLCTTRHCPQMVTLWKHMKACRDKNCKTSHCVSSRCVLNHYRICKSNERTASCEVCGPVMNRIKQMERDDGSDPLTKDELPQQGFQTSGRLTPSGFDVSSDELQLQQVQAQQMKLKAQLDSLKQLQKRQDELLKQQRRLELAGRQVQDPSSPQAQQLRQQQMLLQNLQKKCQQQQLLLQQEVHMQMSLDTSQQQVTSSTSTSEDPLEQPMMSIGGERKTRRTSFTKKKRKTVKGVRTGKGKSLGLGTIIESPPQNQDSIGSDISVESLPFTSSSPPSSKQVIQSTKGKPLQRFEPENSSLIPFMTKESIQKHLESLNKQIRLSSRTVTYKCLPLLQALIDDPYGWVFKDAVDPITLGLPDYFDVVKTPMHLDLVKKKLENAIYSDLEVFARDVRLVFDNAILYNGDASEVGQLAQSMLNKFNDSYANLVHEVESSHLNLEKNGEICSLCGMQNRKFEPPVLYCQGECKMQRINRGAMYYTDRTKQNHWCESCFNVLKPDDGIILDDGSEITKCDLQSFKNDALPEEGWVNCDECNSWVHQVCGLFNGRTNKSTARYTCPNCVIRRRNQAFPASTEKLVKNAVDLPHCKMSEAIENGLYKTLEQAYNDRASELGVSLDEVERAEGLTVRVISNAEKKHIVGEKMLARYGDKEYPVEFPVRTKCIALFQDIHGVDTLLFAVYVYEYGQECPAPNRRRVYISYLDSVQYFEPKCYRTTAYHAIILEYLRYVKRRGFHTAHVWSCPPTAGDDYIFYSHPKHQLVPGEDMLRRWYRRLFDRAKAEGVVLRTTTMFDEYFVKDGIDSVSWSTSEPTCLPYFEGDYIPGEIENIIKLEEGGLPKTNYPTVDSVMARLGHNLGKMKDNFIVVHLRSRRFVDAVQRGEDVSQWKEDCDEEVVRSKRAKISGKDSSVLHHPGNLQQFPGTESVETQTTSHQAETSTVSIKTLPTDEPKTSQEVEASDEPTQSTDKPGESGESTPPTDKPGESLPDEEMKESTGDNAKAVDADSKDKSPKIGEDGPEKVSEATKMKDETPVTETAEATDATSAAGPLGDQINVDKEANAVSEVTSNQAALATESGPMNTGKSTNLAGTEKKEDESVPMESENNANQDNAEKEEDSCIKMDPDESLKRSTGEIEPAIQRHFKGLKRPGVYVGDTADDDDPIEMELFESRQRFLNYCQSAHCQFDDLRRAKHSTMMVLFQLHNPAAPLFLQQCGACYRDIVHGIRYHCSSCSNFDLCQECYEPVTSGLWAKRDPRFAHDETHTFSPIDMEAAEKANKKDQKENLQAHVALLEHAGTCEGPPACSSQNCQRMKTLFAHVADCQTKPKSDCRICSRLLSLCAVHSRKCTIRGKCPVPFCDRIRERNMRLRRQQQLMDDRRRQAQNDLYHATEA